MIFKRDEYELIVAFLVLSIAYSLSAFSKYLTKKRRRDWNEEDD
jgi:hypothetical protein